MAIDLEDEILQDFLVEAGEILEQLGGQLVELENSPEDTDLLNAIFRGFHTIKGGAGFLALDAMVGVCHKSEDVFNILRQGDRVVDTELMDVILQVADHLNEMFDAVHSGNMPEHVEQSLLDKLQSFTVPESAAPAPAPKAEAEPVAEQPVVEALSEEPVNVIDNSEEVVELADASDAVEQEFELMLGSVESEPVADDEITESEFDDLLDTLHGEGGSPTPVEPEKTKEVLDPSGDITEEEFDNLLDELHGKTGFDAANISGAVEEKPPEAVAEVDSGDITEEEFDKVMDDLHGKGTFSLSAVGAESVQEAEAVSNPVNEEAEISAKPKPVALPEEKVAIEPTEKKPVAEKKPAPAKSAPKGEATVRVDTQTLDNIMNMVGELVLVRNRFQTLASEGEDENIAKAVGNLDVVTADLQLAVMKTRMQPIKKVFGRFPRVVRDLARSLKKEITLELVGEETDLDKNLVEALADPLVHLIRNAVDHGIEMPDDREAAGKSREGRVILSASQEGDHIELTIQDNGKGMNADHLRGVAVSKGLMDEESAARLEDKECYNLIFAPGFSTKTEISDVSGRGVGMDVVKTRISQLNGTVEINSEEGVGSVIIIKVPLTLAIMPTLMVKLNEQFFALPLASVLEILDLDLRQTQVVDGQMVIMVRNSALPLFYLSEWLVHDPAYVVDKSEHAHVVVVNSGGRQIGFVVDQLVGQEEVVIKALGAKLHGLDGLAGATITGNGQIALILDVPGLMKRYAG
ncbi:MAG: chemotaxis protein CheA [Methyloprofundus sp.]|nr:chemotaxis protein CheA [Methyloprofundus sp.]